MGQSLIFRKNSKSQVLRLLHAYMYTFSLQCNHKGVLTLPHVNVLGFILILDEARIRYSYYHVI